MQIPTWQLWVDKKPFFGYLQPTSGGTMTTFPPLRSVSGCGRSRVHSMGVAGLVREKFGEYPHLADFLEQCFTLLEKERWPLYDANIGAVLLTGPVIAEILEYMHETLTERFGRCVKVGDGWVRVLMDVDPGRAHTVFGRFMPFACRRELTSAVSPDEFSWLRGYVAATHSEFLGFLMRKQGKIHERRARECLLHVNILACMVAAPWHPGAVVDDAHRFGNFVDILLDDEEVVDDVPDYVPRPEDAGKTTYRGPRVPPAPLHPPPPTLRLVTE